MQELLNKRSQAEVLAYEIAHCDREWSAWDARQLTTRGELTGWSIPVAVGIVSVVFSFILPAEQIAWCGWVYFLMAILIRVHNFLHRRHLRLLN